MVRTKLLLCLFIFTMQAASAAVPSLREALVDVNEQWAYRSADLATVPEEYCDYSSNEIIQKHLFMVHDLLSQKDVSHLTLNERQNREESLKHLLEYAQRGVFPKNLTHPVRRPIFIDHRGVHCAVGYLITHSGHPKLSQRISANMNPYYIKDMEDKYLAEWVAQSGFSLDELAWIQPGYPFPVNWEAMKGGMDGSVSGIISNGQGGVYATGSFDTAGSMAANNLADWYPGFAGYDWKSFSTGFSTNGPINDILEHNGNLYVAGEFTSVNSAATGAPVAMWDGTQWTGLGNFYVGALVNYVNDIEIYRDTLYAAGFFKSQAGASTYFRNLAKWNGSEWVAVTDDTLPGLEYGELNKLHVHQGKLVVAGQFQLQNTQQTENIFRLNGEQVEYFTEDIPNPVYALETHNGELYAGAQYIDQAQTDTAGLVVYRNDKWESLAYFGPWPDAVVRVLESTPDGLIAGGDFWIPDLIGNDKRNILALSNGNLVSLGSLDSTVTSLHHQNGDLYIGGHFTSGYGFGGIQPLGHITSIYLPDFLDAPEEEVQQFALYPNPAQKQLTLELETAERLDALMITDMGGAKLKLPFEQNGSKVKVDVSDLKQGTYLLRLKVGDALMEEPLLIAD